MRSLPENTVDAWTAIELARQGAVWIWLPTTNQGATRHGEHPGDVSAWLRRRLIVIENKGIEGNRSIAFGSDGAAQRQWLQSVEEKGLRELDHLGLARPPLGWVLYGLPLWAGPVDGTGWTVFPAYHYLACPHDLDHWAIGKTACVLPKLCARVRGTEQTNHIDASYPAAPRVRPALALEHLCREARAGNVGLPLPANPADAGRLLGRIAAAARRQSGEPTPEEAEPGNDGERGPGDLAEALGRRHMVLAVF